MIRTVALRLQQHGASQSAPWMHVRDFLGLIAPTARKPNNSAAKAGFCIVSGQRDVAFLQRDFLNYISQVNSAWREMLGFISLTI
jgi:hypothetical protein